MNVLCVCMNMSMCVCIYVHIYVRMYVRTYEGCSKTSESNLLVTVNSYTLVIMFTKLLSV